MGFSGGSSRILRCNKVPPDRVVGVILILSMIILISGMIISAMYEALFGNAVAEKSLLFIANYGEGHINGIAKAFSIAPSQVERQLKKLEAGGILASRMVGNARVFALNRRLAIKDELMGLLEKVLSLLPEEQTRRYFRERRRPRRSGKAL